MTSIEIEDLSGLPQAAAWLIAALGSRRVVAFDAPMGAGKTTLIAEMCRQLGTRDEANSPTFSIINHYEMKEGELPVYHFDFYRLNDAGAVNDIGIYDYLDSGAWCLLEWPQVALPFLPEDTAVVRIEPHADGHRTLTLMN